MPEGMTCNPSNYADPDLLSSKQNSRKPCYHNGYRPRGKRLGWADFRTIYCGLLII